MQEQQHLYGGDRLEMLFDELAHRCRQHIRTHEQQLPSAARRGPPPRFFPAQIATR
jgi:hypothetical protein